MREKASRWRAPTVPPYYIERDRIDRVFAGDERRVIRVLGPSGYGKTSLVARWVASDPRPVRWVDLDRGDDDPVSLFETLRSALSGVVEIGRPSAEHAGAFNPYVRALEDGLVTSPGPFVLVLDDLHRVRGADASYLLTSLLAHVPQGATIVIVGRGHHDHGSIGRLRLTPGVVDVTVRDLAFDESESHRLFELMGVEPSTPEVVNVLRELEGWPAGIRLAAEVVRAGGTLRDVAEHVSLVDVLRGEWMEQLDEADRRFLREAACFQTFTGEKCDEVLERRGSSRDLQRLHRDQVVVFALDERDSWYRMHGLLRMWLSAELRDSDPERWTQIHLNAARYWEARGEIARAVEHVCTAGDLVVLERMVTVHGGRYFTRGLDATVEEWLAEFSPDHVRRSPGLIGLHCLKALHQGNDVEAIQWLRVLDRATRARRGSGDHPTDWWGTVLHAALDDVPAADLLPSAAKARANLAGDPWGVFACWVQGALAFVEGDLAAARDALREGAFEAELTGTHLLVGHCRGTLAIIDDWTGDTVAAAEHANLAEDSLRSCGGELRPPAALAMAAIGLRQARDNDRDAAARSIAAARSSLVGLRLVAPWFNIITRIALVRAVLLLDDRATARILVQELEHHARLEPAPSDRDGHGVAAIVRELRAQVDAMHVPATGSSALTEAELRVLHLLPTNLSLAEIATRLFCSRNTVKSHAASIYRKLDATKRADAVERARAAGLLSTESPS